MDDTLVHVSDVTKRYDSGGRPAVDGVSLEVAPGEAVAVMGPSGSGKSTLLNLVAGLDRPTEGTVTVAGDRIDRLSETGLARFRRAQVGMIFQFFNLLDDLTVLDNVLLPAQLAGVPAKRARARADELLAALRIEQRRDAYPGRLSGGERQRVAIARALVNRPALLLADEPTGALDTATGEEIGELLLDLHSSGQTMILVTHNPDLARRYASRTVRLMDGRLADDARGPVPSQAGATEAGRIGGAVPGQTADAVPGQTADAVPGQTADAVPGQTADAVAGQTADAVAGQAGDAVAGQAGDAVAGQAGDGVAGQAGDAASGHLDGPGADAAPQVWR